MSFLSSLNPLRIIRNTLRAVRKIAGWLIGIPKPQDPKALEITRKGSDHSLPVVYGERKIGPVEVHMFSTSTVTGLTGIISKNETNAYLHIIAAFCHGEIEGFQEFFFDGVSSTDPRFSGRFKIITRNGAPDEEAIPEAVANIPNWNANMRGRHVAYAYIVLYQGKDETVWRGEPDITARVKGKKLYDPRTGVTAYSENNALASLDYLRNNIYGRGLSESQIHLPAFVAAANFCDEGTTSEVTYTRCYNDDDPTAPPICRTYTETVSQPRYKIAGVMDTSALVLDNYKELLQSFRAFPRRPNGLVSLGVETNGTPVMTLDEDDLIGSIVFSKSGQRDRYNRFTIRFPNRLDNFERDEISYPQPDDPLYDTWLAEDNGKELLGELELNTLADKSGAAQTAEIAAKRSRINGSLKIEAGAKARLLEEGDIFGINSYSFGWSNKPFRLEKLSETEDGTFEIEAAEHENSIYPWSGSEWGEQVGGSWLGNPSAPKAPGNLQFFPDSTLATSGLLTWEAVDDAFVRSYEVVILDDQGEPIPTGLENSTRGTRYDIPVLDVGEYTVHVYSVTTLGFRSLPATLSLTLALPVAPTALGLTSSNTTVTSEPVLAGAGIGTEFHFDIDDLSDGSYTPTPRMRGASAVFTGKFPNTEHRVWARTINALGESEWVSGNVKTTNNTSELPPAFIGELESELEELEGKFPVKTVDISNGAVTANKISVDRLSALTANMGVLNAGTINVGGGDDYVIINDTQSYIDVGGRDGRVFRISKDGDSYINGHALGAASVMGESLSQDAIDFIIAAIGAATPDSGGVRSLSVVPSSTTRTLDTFNSNGSAVQLRVAYGGQSSGRILCGQGQQPPTPPAPEITVTVRRGTAVLFNQTYYGSVTLGEVVSEYCRDIQVEMPAIDIDITDSTPPQGSISYNIVMVVYWPSELGSLHTRLDFRSSQNAMAGGGGVSTWAQLSGKPFGTVGAGLEVAADALRVKYGAAAGTAVQGNDTRITGAAQKSANLSDLSNASSARQNLGLGTAAVLNASEPATASTVALRKPNSRLEVASAISDNDAVNLAQLKTKVSPSDLGSAAYRDVGTANGNLMEISRGSWFSSYGAPYEPPPQVRGVDSTATKVMYSSMNEEGTTGYAPILQISGSNNDTWGRLSIGYTEITQRAIVSGGNTREGGVGAHKWQADLLHSGSVNQTKSGALTAHDFILS